MIKGTSDGKVAVFFLSKEDNHIMAKHTAVGGVGSGRVAPRDPEVKNAIPWTLPPGA